MARKSAWEKYDAASLQRIDGFAKEYRAFIDQGKTERECVALARQAAEAAGFTDLEQALREGKKLNPGDRVYRCWMNKSIVLFIVGERALREGMRILGAHIDSPRIDLKQNPLYEEDGLAYLDTQYYGGIKKYQWVALPLALHGVVVRIDGSVLTVSIGESEEDPVFCISDLLPHLAQDQLKLDGEKLIDGEALNLIVGGYPLPGDEKEPVKANVLKLLKRKYNIEEEDFISAELELVPAGKSRDMGFDGSMILGYGHDDRVCAYPSMRAVLDYKGTPAHTLCAVLTDKEEIGSVGATGMRSHYFENIVSELLACTAKYSEFYVKRALSNSRMLSSDVSAGYDPNYASVFEKKNAAFLGSGVCFNKYTGGRGKASSSDANAEFIGELRRIMRDGGVTYQFAELGKVDVGGGGTIAYMCAKYCMNVIDCGVPVLSMHAPWEIISKVDLYEAYRCYCAFLRG
ncbi:MAG: aminopeptidase [Eubacteriales bacterium]|nr:aminopeptidase [Eubacteriales bacterium]